MKKIFFLCCFLVFTFASCKSQGEQEKAVAAAVEEFKKGLINADRGLLESLTADQLIYGHSGGKVQNKSEFIDEVISLQPNDYLTIDFIDQTIIVSEETAVVRHIFSAGYISNGVSGNLKVGNMMIWQKQQGKWRLFARQAYRL